MANDPHPLTPQDCLVAIMIAVSASDEEIRTSELVIIQSIVKHLPIFSFLIKCGERFLHYNFVCALLNDIFGIQSRGGCQCAGPYAQRLLGMPKHCDANGTGCIIDPVEMALLAVCFGICCLPASLRG